MAKFSNKFLLDMALWSKNPKVLDKLADHTNPDIVYSVAINKSTHPDTLSRLSRHLGWMVREAVAQHPRTPGSVLHKLKDDEDDEVKDAARWTIGKRVSESIADGLIHQVLAECM